MLKSIRRFVVAAALLTVLAVLGVFTTAAAVRADDPPNMQDYNTYWQVANDPAQRTRRWTTTPTGPRCRRKSRAVPTDEDAAMGARPATTPAESIETAKRDMPLCGAHKRHVPFGLS